MRFYWQGRCDAEGKAVAEVSGRFWKFVLGAVRRARGKRWPGQYSGTSRKVVAKRLRVLYGEVEEHLGKCMGSVRALPGR